MKLGLIKSIIAGSILVTSSFAVEQHWYNIASDINLDKVWDLNGDGAKVKVWDRNNSQCQQFYVKDNGGGQFKIIHRQHISGRIEDPNNGGAGNQLGYCTGDNSDAWQRWYFDDMGSGKWRIVLASNGLMVDLDGANTANGTAVKVWNDNGGNAQRWHLINVGVASVYGDTWYGGARLDLVPGTYILSDLLTLGMGNDAISSIKVSNGYSITLYENDNFGGASITLNGDDGNLVNPGWNDRTSSIKVEQITAPSYGGYTLWSNENFDNGWDGSKWMTGCGTFGENATRFRAENVYTSGGLLHLKIERAPGNYGPGGCENAGQVRDYYGGEFRMINPSITYGIAEARIKTPGNGGYIASLFTYDYGAATNRTDGWNEIDIELEGSYTDRVSTNLLEGNCSHSWECTQWCYCACAERNSFGGYHTDWHDYRIEFAPTYVKWFVDGNNIRTIDGGYVYRNPNGEDVRYASATNGCLNGWRNGYIPGHSTRVMANFWLATHGSVANALGGEWNDGQLPKECLYDWIRVYTKN